MAQPVHDYARVDKHLSARRADSANNPYSPVMIMIAVIATLGIVFYGQFLLNPDNRGDFLPYTLVIVAESVLIGHALLAMWTIFSGARSPHDFAFHAAKRALFDPGETQTPGGQLAPEQWPVRLDGRKVIVDVLITVCGEALDKIRATATAAVAIKGQHRTWILDDGRSDDVRALAVELGCRYVRRLSSNGAKAGNINHALTLAKGDFFCVFDADFVPHQDFLVETLPFFTNPTVAFVQTPQTYGNLTNMISRGAGYMQTVFYRFIQPGRNHFNAAFCVGTNVMFRRTAIDDVGGIYTDSKSEDVWTSLMLHERGWRSIYIAKTLALGDAPNTIEAYTKQQLRWATGGFEILLSHNPFSPRRRLTPDQRIMYLVTASQYLTGIAPGLLLLVPPLEIFLDLRPVNLSIAWTTWLLFYAGFYLMQVGLAFYTLGSFRWEVLMLAAVSFPIYAQALFNAFAEKEQKWHVTGGVSGPGRRRRRTDSPFNFMVPQVAVFVFLLLTSVVAVWRDLNNSQLTLATAWNVTNTFILGAFMLVGCREAWQLRHPRAVRAVAVQSAATEAWRTVVIAPPRPEPRREIHAPVAGPSITEPLGHRPAASRPGRRALVRPPVRAHDPRPTPKESVLS